AAAKIRNWWRAWNDLRRIACRRDEQREVASAKSSTALLVLDGNSAEDFALIFPRRDVHQLRPRAVRRRVPVRAALGRRVSGQVGWMWGLERPAIRIEAAHPVDAHERLAEEEFARGSIEDVEVAVAIGPEQRLDGCSAERDVGEHRHLNGIEIVDVVRR